MRKSSRPVMTAPTPSPKCSRNISARSNRSLCAPIARDNLTQRQLAELTGIPQRHISEMATGKRVIGKELAKRLGKALLADYQVFL